jgi:ABC-2 type transport system ATP-binding protein
MRGGVQSAMLDVQHLTKRYGALTAIQDVSFTVRPGEVLGLLGPNGSGKSTTVKILTGLLQATSGTVCLDGTDTFANRQAYKSTIGYVPEEPHLYSYLTGPEYLQLVGRLRRIPDAVLDDKIERFLKLLGIFDDRYQTLSSYSKGMRQKVLISAAVLHNPRIVILDEAFSGLDVSAARVLKAFVRALAEEGKIVVFSSHVLEVVEQVCSRVVILKDGRIVGHDSVAKSSQHPSTSVTRRGLCSPHGRRECGRSATGAHSSHESVTCSSSTTRSRRSRTASLLAPRRGRRGGRRSPCCAAPSSRSSLPAKLSPPICGSVRR